MASRTWYQPVARSFRRWANQTTETAPARTEVLRPLARRLGAFALFGGGSAGLIGGALAVTLAIEAAIAKRTIGDAVGDGPDPDGIYHPTTRDENLPDNAEPLSFLVLGDSAARGYGVEEAGQTPGALLAAGLAELTGRPVRLTVVAVVGAETKHLDAQLDLGLEADPSLALIIIGVNDVIHRTSPAVSVSRLLAALERLDAAGVATVVGTCPDLGTIEPLPPPLRQIARTWSRRLAEAQRAGLAPTGTRAVALGPLLGPEFAAAPRELFGPDRFHPSATGYAHAAAALLPSLAAAAGAWPDDESADRLDDGPILPITFAD